MFITKRDSKKINFRLTNARVEKYKNQFLVPFFIITGGGKLILDTEGTLGHENFAGTELNGN